MITFIERCDVEEAATQAVLRVNKEIAHYLKDASPDPAATGNLMARVIKNARNVFLIELLGHSLISSDCYHKLHDIKEAHNAR